MQAVFLHQHLVVLEKERVAGVAAFNAAVHVVPMVQHAQYIGGGGGLVQLQFLPGAAGGLQGAQKGKHAVQHPDLAAAGNGAAAPGGRQAVAFGVQGRVHRQGNIRLFCGFRQPGAVQTGQPGGQFGFGVGQDLAACRRTDGQLVTSGAGNCRVGQPAFGISHS